MGPQRCWDGPVWAPEMLGWAHIDAGPQRCCGGPGWAYRDAGVGQFPGWVNWVPMVSCIVIKEICPFAFRPGRSAQPSPSLFLSCTHTHTFSLRSRGNQCGWVKAGSYLSAGWTSSVFFFLGDISVVCHSPCPSTGPFNSSVLSTCISE